MPTNKLKDAACKGAKPYKLFDGGGLYLYVLPSGAKVWRAAYLQFCTHFAAPLALLSHCNSELNRLSQLWVSGIPLELASALLPLRTWLSPQSLLHIHWHARMQKKFGDASKAAGAVT